MGSHSASLAIEISTKVIGAAAVVGFAKDIVGAASDAEQAVGAVDAVFKGNAQAIKDWSAASGKALGLSKTDYQTLATTIGSQLKSAGTSMSDLAPKTNDLIQLGADLAAQYGGTTADAVSALSSLLKGETDPIEKYGVSIKAADVAAQKAEMGLTGLTGAADKQATAQATLALLTKQTADATGANAREADTAAGKQARLTAAWEDASAAMGTSLLPAFSALMDIASKLIPVITPIVSVVGDIVSVVAGLPGPVLAAGAAFAVWLKYGDQITGFLGSLGSKAKGIDWGKLAGAGGIAVATFAISKMIEGFTEGSRRAEEFRAKTSALADSLSAAGGKWDEASTKMLQSGAEQDKGFKALMDAGISYGDAMDLVTGKLAGTSKEQEILAKAAANSSDDQLASILGLANGTQALAGDSAKLAKERLAYAAANKTATSATEDGLTAAKDAAAATQQSADAAKAGAQAYDDWSSATADAAAAQQELIGAQLEAAAAGTDLQKALDETSDSANDAKRALDGVNTVLDTLSGRNRSAEEAAADLNKSFIDMKDTATDAAKAGDLNKAALASWNVTALTANQTGQDVYDSLNDVQGAYAASTAAAYSNTASTKGVAAANDAARAAASRAYGQFITTATGLGLTTDQARKLADSLGIVEGKKLTDKQMAIIAKDKEAKDKLDAFNAKKTPDKTAKIKAEAETAQAQAEINAVAAKEYTARLNVEITKTVNTIQNAIGGIVGNLGLGKSAGVAGMYAGVPLPEAFAPGVGARATNLGTYTVPINVPASQIVIQGALDPPAVARQIRAILQSGDRRARGVHTGRATRGALS